MREIIDRAGPLLLARTGATWEILWDGTFLMSSQCRASERALGALARGQTLVAGLGMGFTLRAALDRPPVTSIDVVEIAAAVVDWNRGPLAALADRPLDDPRVRVHVADLARFLGQPHEAWDTILLDLDNGPSWIARPENAWLYQTGGLSRLRACLRAGGRLAIWLAQPEPALLTRLRAHFAAVDSRAVAVTVGGRPSQDYILVAACETQTDPAVVHVGTRD